MRILISVAEGFLLSETSRVIYSPGYQCNKLAKSEHEILCDIATLVEAKLVQENIQVTLRLYNEQRHAEFAFDKARHAKGHDAAIFLALNSSQNDQAQFGTNMVHMIQDGNSRRLFESMMASFQRFLPVQTRYPNQMKKIPFLGSCQRHGVPAIVSVPFFLTEGKLDNNLLGNYIAAAALALSEGVKSYFPERLKGGE